jgi:hypothetical protein
MREPTQFLEAKQPGFRTMVAASLVRRVSAQEAVKKPHVPLDKTIGEVTPSAPVPSLAVINSTGAKIEGGKLVLTGVSPTAIVLADRAVRAAGHVTTKARRELFRV